MIIVNIRRSHRRVLNGELTLEDATRGNWTAITDDAVEEYGDTIVGVVGDEVVSAFDITGHTRDEAGLITFSVRPSAEFAYLVGQPSPVGPWVKGQGRPIRYLHSDYVRHGDVSPEGGGNYSRAIVGGYTLVVDGNGRANVIPPAGGTVIVLPPARADHHPLQYLSPDGEICPCQIIDKHPAGELIFIEYLRNGIPTIANVDEALVVDDVDPGQG